MNKQSILGVSTDQVVLGVLVGCSQGRSGLPCDFDADLW